MKTHATVVTAAPAIAPPAPAMSTSPCSAPQPSFLANSPSPASLPPTPRDSAIALLALAISTPPRISHDVRAACLSSRKAATARTLLARLAHAPDSVFYPTAFDSALAAYGISSRDTIVECLRAYHAMAYVLTRGGSETAAQRVLARQLSGATRVARHAAVAARDALKAAEDARAALGHALLVSRGAFS